MISLDLPSDFVLSILKATAGVLLLALPFGLAYVGLVIYGCTLRPADRNALWAHTLHPVFSWGFLLLLLGLSIAWPIVRSRIDPCDREAAENPQFVPQRVEMFRVPIPRPGVPIHFEPRPGEPTAIYICVSYGEPDNRGNAF